MGDGDWSSRFRLMSPLDAFAWLIAPVTVETFFSEYWEKKPLHIARGDSSYYDGLLTQAMMSSQLQLRRGLQYEKDINVARCVDGKQIMSNGKGYAKPADISCAEAEGCSVQVVHPQRFVPALAALLARLESHFGCLWGSNSFRTPPDSRGFKAHHDEVEAFMLQLGGAKQWTLHACPKGPLPRGYCWDYAEEDLGKPLMEICLKAGDLLYMPRGTVHRGRAAGTAESHHLTVSTYQRNSWADFLGRALTEALQSAAAADVRYREGLPLRSLGVLGDCHRPRGGAVGPGAEGRAGERAAFGARLRELVAGLAEHADAAADVAGDYFAAQFVARRLPPVRSAEAPTSGPDPAPFSEQGGDAARRLQLRWTDPGAVRVVTEQQAGGDMEIQVYHSRENSASAHLQEVEPEPACLVLEGDEFASALRILNQSTSRWAYVAELGEPPPWELVQGLWEQGLAETREAVEPMPAARGAAAPRRHKCKRRSSTAAAGDGAVAEGGARLPRRGGLRPAKRRRCATPAEKQ